MIIWISFEYILKFCWSKIKTNVVQFIKWNYILNDNEKLYSLKNFKTLLKNWFFVTLVKFTLIFGCDNKSFTILISFFSTATCSGVLWIKINLLTSFEKKFLNDMKSFKTKYNK